MQQHFVKNSSAKEGQFSKVGRSFVIYARAKASSRVVSYPDPALREGKGLVIIEQFLGFAESSFPRACENGSVLIVKHG